MASENKNVAAAEVPQAAASREGDEFQIKVSIQEKIPAVAKELLKLLIRNKTLVFTSDDLGRIIADVFDTDDISDLYDKVFERLSKALEETGIGLTILNISDYGADIDTYVIAPVDLPEQFVKRLVEKLIERNQEEVWIELVSEEVEEWDAAARSHGPAYVYIKLAQAWGVEFSEEIIRWNKYDYTGVKRLSLDNAHIYLIIGYGNSNGYIYKSLWYSLDLEE